MNIYKKNLLSTLNPSQEESKKKNLVRHCGSDIVEHFHSLTQFYNFKVLQFSIAKCVPTIKTFHFVSCSLLVKSNFVLEWKENIFISLWTSKVFYWVFIFNFFRFSELILFSGKIFVDETWAINSRSLKKHSQLVIDLCWNLFTMYPFYFWPKSNRCIWYVSWCLCLRWMSINWCLASIRSKKLYCQVSCQMSNQLNIVR